MQRKSRAGIGCREMKVKSCAGAASRGRRASDATALKFLFDFSFSFFICFFLPEWKSMHTCTRDRRVA